MPNKFGDIFAKGWPKLEEHPDRGPWGFERAIAASNRATVVLRGNLLDGPDCLEFMATRRAPGMRWAGGIDIGVGGFINPDDDSALSAVYREGGEEVGRKVKARIARIPFCTFGPAKVGGVWDETTQCAVSTDKLTQNAPIVTDWHLAVHVEGGPTTSEEVEAVWWENLGRFASKRQDKLNFEHAYVLGELLAAIKQVQAHPPLIDMPYTSFWF